MIIIKNKKLNGTNTYYLVNFKFTYLFYLGTKHSHEYGNSYLLELTGIDSKKLNKINKNLIKKYNFETMKVIDIVNTLKFEFAEYLI